MALLARSIEDKRPAKNFVDYKNLTIKGGDIRRIIPINSNLA